MEVSGDTAFVSWGVAFRICLKQHVAFLCSSHLVFLFCLGMAYPTSSGRVELVHDFLFIVVLSSTNQDIQRPLYEPSIVIPILSSLLRTTNSYVRVYRNILGPSIQHFLTNIFLKFGNLSLAPDPVFTQRRLEYTSIFQLFTLQN